jgi:hypothetical protein
MVVGGESREQRLGKERHHDLCQMLLLVEEDVY